MTAAVFDLIGQHAITRGCAWRFVFRRQQANRIPVDLTGLTARLEVFDTQKARQAPSVFASEGTLGADGEVVFDLTGDQTRSIRATAARYRILFVDSAGEATVFLRGRLALLEPWK
jgi:hypothetical protein